MAKDNSRFFDKKQEWSKIKDGAARISRYSVEYP